MKENFDKALAAVLHHEGGFVNHPDDPGGMTNLGCTKRTWEEWVKHPVDEAAMRALTPRDVAPLYKKKYWDAVHGDDLPTGVDYLVFDFAINAGPGRAAKTLQQALGVTADGAIGPATFRAVDKADAAELVKEFSRVKEHFYKSLPAFDKFGKGWLRRVAEVGAVAETMVA
jgi:lysozyme family protein